MVFILVMGKRIIMSESAFQRIVQKLQEEPAYQRNNNFYCG